MARSAAVDAAIHAALDRLILGGPVGVAVSGGGDSMALLVIARNWAAQCGHDFYAATVDHALRAESTAEAAMVASYCAEADIPHEVLPIAPLPARGNLAANARSARFGALAEWAGRHGLEAVLLGHTMDDQAETVLMRLARGSGLEGLSAMRERHDRVGATWLRPMLGIRRADLRDWLVANDIAWVEDPTNEDPRFDRVKTRRALELLGPVGVTVDGLAETATRLGGQLEILHSVTSEHAGKIQRWGPFGEGYLHFTASRGLDDTKLHDIERQILAECLRSVSGAEHRPRFKAVERLYARAIAPDFSGATLGGCLIQPTGDNVLICREPEATAPPIGAASRTIWDGRWDLALDAPEGTQVGRFDAAAARALKNAADARTWTASGTWTDAPACVRATLPVLWQGDPGDPENVLAIPHAGYFARQLPKLGRISVEHTHIAGLGITRAA